jgi:predicted KAP-like P-loop ATPase
MWPDNETKKDLIGFKVHADLIRAVVTNHAMLPTTIGIFGDWGGGKTSIMRMLESDLDSENWPKGSAESKQYESVAVVYANAWLFEGYDDTKAALLSSVLSELAQHKRFGPKIRDAAISLLQSVDWMRVARFTMKHVAIPAAAAFFTGGVSAITPTLALSLGLATSTSKPGQDTEKKDDGKQKTENEKISWEDFLKKSPIEAHSMDVRTFRERFGKMLTDGGITTLVVLIDDLDRCTPERIIDNLEAVKLFLSVEQTAFVIGADRRIVEHAIRSRYSERNDEETNRLVKDYLEKLVQIPYSLPRLSTTEIETYMALLFCQHYQEAKNFDTCLKACEENRKKNRYSSFGYAGIKVALKGTELSAELTQALSFSAASAPLIADGLKGNPRQVKRFLNALLLRKELAKVANLEHIRDDVLVKLMILEYTHPELFAQLFTLQSQQNGLPKEIGVLESIVIESKGEDSAEEPISKIDSQWATKSIRKWLYMEPFLKDVDLRDYFWVARDRLQSTFSGISMVPPIVRKVLDGLMSDLTPKRNEAMKMAPSLTEDELASLLNLIDQLISRKPNDIAGYNALLYLSETENVKSAQLLNTILIDRPLGQVPTPIGMKFMTIYKAKTKLQPILDPARKELLKSDTLVGRAAQSAK